MRRVLSMNVSAHSRRLAEYNHQPTPISGGSVNSGCRSKTNRLSWVYCLYICHKRRRRDEVRNVGASGLEQNGYKGYSCEGETGRESMWRSKSRCVSITGWHMCTPLSLSVSVFCMSLGEWSPFMRPRHKCTVSNCSCNGEGVVCVWAYTCTIVVRCGAPLAVTCFQQVNGVAPAFLVSTASFAVGLPLIRYLRKKVCQLGVAAVHWGQQGWFVRQLLGQRRECDGRINRSRLCPWGSWRAADRKEGYTVDQVFPSPAIPLRAGSLLAKSNQAESKRGT